MDEMDDRDTLFYADLTQGECDTVATIQKRTHLNIDYENSDSADDKETLLADPGLKFPLFDYNFRHWFVQKSFSSSGKYIVYYRQDISGIVIGTSDGADVNRIFKLSSEVARDDNQFGYDDFKDIFLFSQFFHLNLSFLLVKVLIFYTLRIEDAELKTV